MEIICPDCKFSREVDETKIPARSQVATCPKCQTKFKFRELPEEEPVMSETVQPAPPESEPSPVRQDLTPTSVTEEPERTFPKITAPGEDTKEELWDKLGDMTPPDGMQDNTPEATHVLPTEAVSEQEPVPGWTGEFNESFPDPMSGGAEQEQDEAPSMTMPPPFEQLDRYGFFHGLYMTIKLVLTSPRLFFSVMPVGGGLAKPLAFTILVTMIQGFAQYFWGIAGLSESVTPESAEAVGGLSTTLVPIMMLLFMPAFIAAGQFIITGVYHLLLILMRADNQGFEGTFRALAYANAPIVLGIFPMPIIEIEVCWMGIAAIWGLFLTIMGLKHIHKVPFSKVIPVALIPLLLALIGAFLLYSEQLPTV